MIQHTRGRAASLKYPLSWKESKDNECMTGLSGNIVSIPSCLCSKSRTTKR